MTDEKVTFKEIKTEIANLVASKGWLKVHTPKNLAVSISIEVGELMEIIQWADDDEQKEILVGTGKEKFVGEISDILIYIFCLANLLDIDLSDALMKKIKQNIDRFPDYPPTQRTAKDKLRDWIYFGNKDK